MRRALVTGAYGMLGAWLAKALLDEGAEVVVLKRDRRARAALTIEGIEDRCHVVHGDLLDAQLLERVVDEYEIDTVFHLAAQTIVGAANRSPASTFDSNIRGTWNAAGGLPHRDRCSGSSSPRPTRPTAATTSCPTARTSRCSRSSRTTSRRPRPT